MSAVSLVKPQSVDPIRGQFVARGGRSLVEAWGELLAPFRFDWFATLTFRNNVPRPVAEVGWRDLCRWLRAKAGHRVEWFRVAELQTRGVVHFHALVGDCAGVRRLSAVDWWRDRYGFAQVQPYDPGRGARFYLTKPYVAKGALRGDIDVAFSRRFAALGAGSDLGPASGVPLMQALPGTKGS